MVVFGTIFTSLKYSSWLEKPDDGSVIQHVKSLILKIVWKSNVTGVVLKQTLVSTI